MQHRNILIDIGHPAHVHLFRCFIGEMRKKGHRVFVAVKNVPAAKKLLGIYSLPYFDLGKKADSLFGKLVNQLHYDRLLYQFVREHNIDYGLGSSITITHVSKITRMKSFVFDDDDSKVEPLFSAFGHRFADYIITPECLKFENYGRKHITYDGYHELAYLHPRRFTPDIEVLREIGLGVEDVYFVLRFNAFKAHHDRGARGLSIEQKRALIRFLSERGKVLITTERDIEDEFEKYRLKVSPEKIHSLLYFATMFLGDSQTMTSEASLLGTPAVKCNSFSGQLSVPNEIENKYGLCWSFRPEQGDAMIEKVKELVNEPHLRARQRERREKMLSEKIDVTAFLVWLVENYPESVNLLRERPSYQERFR